jgi:hypothetical protein
VERERSAHPLHEQVSKALDRAARAQDASQALIEECRRTSRALDETIGECRRTRSARATGRAGGERS